MKRRSNSKRATSPKNQLDLFVLGDTPRAAPSMPLVVTRPTSAAVKTRREAEKPAQSIKQDARPLHSDLKGGSVNGLLDVREAAAYVGLSKSTLDKMRCYAKGPRYIKLTSSAVRYDTADLKAWIETRRSSPT